MKKRIMAVFTTLAVLAFTGTALAEVTSLRGDQELDDLSKAASKRKQLVVEGGIERSYKLQPPVIPHSIDKDQINLKVNTCMKCHSEKTYVEKKAPRIGDSHYVARDGKVLDSLSSRRYFCNQCHAPQLNAEPLVDNNFQGAQ